MMARCFYTIMLLLLSYTFVAAQNKFAGTWSGSLNAGGAQLPLVFHVTADAAGKLTATMDSPSQGAKGIHIQQVRHTNDSLYLNMPAIGGGYAGKLTSPETIAGHWKQSGQSFALQLTKGEAEAPKRPQMPKKPYPYQEQEVKVENKTAGITLAGTLTTPQGKGPFPAAILITGSGPQDRDETIMGHKPFLVLADYLTRQGFAVLRLDDRGVGGSGGNPATATTQDFTSDIAAAYTFLGSNKSINSKKIGLIGHSEGGLVATKLAAQNPDIAFVVLMAGSGVAGTELLLAQNEALLKVAGMPEEQLQKYLNLRKAQFAVAATETDAPKAADKIRKLEQEAKASIPAQEQKMMGLTPQSEQAIVTQLSTPWYRSFLAYNPAPDLKKLKMPVLALIGSKDLQVPAAQNLKAIEDALKAGGNQKYTVKELANLNHLFQTATTGMPTEYGQLEETIAPVALQTIADWLKSMTK